MKAPKIYPSLVLCPSFIKPTETIQDAQSRLLSLLRSGGAITLTCGCVLGAINHRLYATCTERGRARNAASLFDQLGCLYRAHNDD